MTEPTPPWGTNDEFDPDKAWTLIQNLRSEVDEHKRLNAELEKKSTGAEAEYKQQLDVLTSSNAELQSGFEDLAAQLSEASSGRIAAIRDRLAVEKGLPVETVANFVTGTDEESIASQIDALAALRGEQKQAQAPGGYRVIDPAQAAPSTPDEQSVKDAFARQIFQLD